MKNETKRPWPKTIGGLILQQHHHKTGRWSAVYTTPGAEYTHDPAQYGDPRWCMNGDYSRLSESVRLLFIYCEQVERRDEDGGSWLEYGDSWCVDAPSGRVVAAGFRRAVNLAKQTQITK